jgi:hypothetical protein
LDQEAIMAHALAHTAATPTHRAHRPLPREEALDPIRGIMIGVLLSIAGFWLPLALVLAR